MADADEDYYCINKEQIHGKKEETQGGMGISFMLYVSLMLKSMKKKDLRM